MATVAELAPGDLVTQATMSGVFISRGAHPLRPALMLVIWRLGDRWSFDALDLNQEVGDVAPSTAQERHARLRAALLGEKADPETSACQAEALDGHEHTKDVIEYMGICVRGHERRGMICGACARPLHHRGPAALTCADCPEDDPRPRALVPADVWAAMTGEVATDA